MILCPFCDGNGLIYQAKIKNQNEVIYICDECDTIWHSKDINENNCDNFENYMGKHGLEAIWGNLADLVGL